MAITTGSFNFYDSVKGQIGKGLVDLDTQTFAVLLTTSAYTPDSATHNFVDDITNEVAGGTGYSRQNLANPSFVLSGGGNGQMKFDSDDPVWTASGGSITARYWVLFENTNVTDATRNLVAWGLLDNSPADVTATDTNTLTITVNAGGWFTMG